ncbi:hypothetical protein [Streptomyces sp. NPDC046685]|uniref:DUF7210 family protein n=1 Tax=Streptomyces sp. NPDC046685 TaxID=3157202 RepID=UPI0033CC20B9
MTTIKKTTTASSDTPAENSTVTAAPLETTPTPVVAAAVVGPALVGDAVPQTVVLSHHLRIGGTDYAPGDKILVSPDYARRLRAQGYTART